MTDVAGAETEMRDALRRLRADGVQRLGERVRELATGWTALQPRRPWDATARAQLGELAASAHRLAGAGGTFGFPALSKAAAPLELLLLGLRDTPSPRGDRLRQTAAQIEAVTAAWEAGPAGTDEPGTGGPALASHSEHGEPVFLFAEAEEQAMLSAVIANLGYSVRRASEQEVLEGTLPEGQLSAAVIDDAVPDPLAVCRRLAGRCPLILLAGDSSFENRLAATRAGVEALVAKPLEVNELADWLDHFAGNRAESRHTIVIVDDDQLLAAAYAMALRQAGMHVTSVSDPAQAIEVIAATAPDLILMDLQMPGIDGIELARVIRQTRRHLSLPILFLSAEQDIQRQILARRLGGDDFIPKPVDLDRLVTLVRLRAERAKALRAVMESDSLTGLLNHARFKERLGLELERARRHGATLSLVLLDLDHFKSVNDNHGHLVGDRVIRGLARSLQKRLRRTDIIGRYGGEEFAALLIGTGPEEARGIVDHLRERFAATDFETEGGSFNVTLSAGIAGNAGGVEAEAMISAADAALYAAKRAGRNRVMLAPA